MQCHTILCYKWFLGHNSKQYYLLARNVLFNLKMPCYNIWKYIKMIISSKLANKKYRNRRKIKEEDYDSHYCFIAQDIVIYLPQVLNHSLDCKGIKPEDRIEQAFTQHVTHELIHKLLDVHEDIYTSRQFDNLGSNKTYKIEGKFSLKNWFGGMLDKEV